jgi:hypothetical protein
MARLILGLPLDLLDGVTQDADGENFEGASLRVQGAAANLPDVSAYGEAVTVPITPRIQALPIYGRISKINSVNIGTGAATVENSLFSCSTGTTAGSVATIFTRRAVGFRAGQGTVGIGSASFTAGQTGTGRQSAGLQNGSDDISFGYTPSLSSEFGISYRARGLQEIRRIDITAASTSTGNVTVTLNNTAYVVALTSTGSIAKNADDIAEAINSTPGTLWRAYAANGDVIAYYVLTSGATGTYSYNAGTTGSAATITQLVAGQAATAAFFPQSAWNGLPQPNLDPTKINEYKIQVGGEDVSFFIKSIDSGKFELVHRYIHANTSNLPMFNNPSFRWSWVASNGNTTDDIDCVGDSCMIGVQGIIGDPAGTGGLSFTREVTTAETVILSIENRHTLGGKVNLGNIYLNELETFIDSAKGGVFTVYKSSTLDGNYDFQYFDETNSIAITDTVSEAQTGGNSVASSLSRRSGSNIDLAKLNVVLLPGERLTITAKVNSGAEADATAVLTWQED